MIVPIRWYDTMHGDLSSSKNGTVNRTDRTRNRRLARGNASHRVCTRAHVSFRVHSQEDWKGKVQPTTFISSFSNVGWRRHRWIHSSVPTKCFSIHPMLCFASLFVRLCRRCRLFWCFHLIKDVVPVAPLSLFRESVSSSVPNESRSTKTTFEDEDDTRKGSRWSNGMKDIEWMVCRVGFGSSIRSKHVLSTSFDSKKVEKQTRSLPPIRVYTTSKNDA